MDKPIRELVNASLLAAKAAVNTVNAKHLAIPHRPAYDRSNPGSIALAMIRESTHPSDPLSVIKHVGRIRAETRPHSWLRRSNWKPRGPRRRCGWT